jgi:CrcB protein
MTAALVVLGGAAGALTRFYAERWAVHRFRERMPWGTLLVNLVGALLLGIVAGLDQRGVVPPSLLVLLGAGYCGTLTTFSGFMGQVDNRLRHKATRALAIRYVSGVTFAGMALAGIAYRLAAGA